MLELTSILIPCFRSAPWLEETLDSALLQRDVPLDIVVVDDGSPDESLTIARRYERHGVRVIEQPNRGAGAARNVALRVARGQYLQFLDADDLLSPTKIAEQVALLRSQPPNRVAISRTVHFADGMDPQTGVLNDCGPWFNTDDPAAWLIELLGPDGNGAMVQTSAYLVPRDVAERAGPWEEFESPDDDGEYFGRVLLASSGIVRSEPAVSYYRKHEGGTSLSGARSAERQRGAIRSLDLRMKALLAVRDTPRVRRGFARAYMDRAVLAYPAYPEVAEAALERVDQLGGTNWLPAVGGRGITLVRDLLGWKAARRASTCWQRVKHLSLPRRG